MSALIAWRALLSRAASPLSGSAPSADRVPPPLVDSSKCPRCSLVGICLPDEVSFLHRGETQPRPLAVARDEALPASMQARSAKVAKSGETLEIAFEDETIRTARLGEVSQLALTGNVHATTPCLHEPMTRQIPVTRHSFGGWFIGHTIGTGHKNVELRAAPYRASFDLGTCLRIAKGLVVAKLSNQRTQLRRNRKEGQIPEPVLEGFRFDFDRARRARSLEELLGIEGNAAARYFGHFRQVLG